MGCNLDCLSVHCNLIWAAIPAGVPLFTHSLYVSCFVVFTFQCYRMSSTVAAVFLLNWSQRYCSTVMGIAFMSLLFLVISLPIFVCIPFTICYCGYDLLSLPLCHESTVHHLLNEPLQQIIMEKKHDFLKCHGFYSLFVFWCFIMLYIIIWINQRSIDYWHNASY